MGLLQVNRLGLGLLMAPPWTNAEKKIIDFTHFKRSAPLNLAAPSFEIPDAINFLTFGPGRLFASVARCNALSYANVLILAAQQLASQAALNLFVDENGNSFSITDDARMLGDAKLGAIAHDIGAGIANLYMNELGYHWVASGKQMISGKGKKPDYLYDRGVGSIDLAAMEAKGAIGKTVSKAAIMSRVNAGYEFQVQPWLGFKSHNMRVIQGYAIGALANAGKASAEIVVQETGWPAPALPSSSSLASISPPSAPSASIAYANYETIFRLIGAQGIVSALRKRRLFNAVDGGQEEELSELEYFGRKFLVGGRLSAFDVMTMPLAASRFGLDLEVAQSFLEYLVGTPSMNEVLILRTIPQAAFEQARGDSHHALFADGLALIDHRPPIRKWRWSSQNGLRRL